MNVAFFASVEQEVFEIDNFFLGFIKSGRFNSTIYLEKNHRTRNLKYDSIKKIKMKRF